MQGGVTPNDGCIDRENPPCSRLDAGGSQEKHAHHEDAELDEREDWEQHSGQVKPPISLILAIGLSFRDNRQRG
jgi:hypothetical protein